MAAHSVTSNPSGTWNRSSGIRTGWSVGCLTGLHRGRPERLLGAAGVSTRMSITVRADKVSRGICVPLIVERLAAR